MNAIIKNAIEKRTRGINTLLSEDILPCMINKDMIDLDILEVFIQSGRSINEVDSYGDTALIKACHFGYMDIVELLLKYNANMYLINNDGYCACDIAKSRGHKAIVEILHNSLRNYIINTGI